MSLTPPYQNLPNVDTSLPFWGAPVLSDSQGKLYCPGFEGNTYSTNPWDYLQFFSNFPVFFNNPAPVISPGLCRVECPRHRAHDKKKSAGTDGARVTVHGLQVSDIIFHIKIWTPEQYKQLGILWGNIFAGPQNITSNTNSVSIAQVPIPYQVSHPQLKLVGLHNLIFTGCDGPKEAEPNRARVFTMYAVEYAPPDPKKNATSTPLGVVANIGTGLDPGANTPPPNNTDPNK